MSENLIDNFNYFSMEELIEDYINVLQNKVKKDQIDPKVTEIITDIVKRYRETTQKVIPVENNQ